MAGNNNNSSSEVLNGTVINVETLEDCYKMVVVVNKVKWEGAIPDSSKAQHDMELTSAWKEFVKGFYKQMNGIGLGKVSIRYLT